MESLQSYRQNRQSSAPWDHKLRDASSICKTRITFATQMEFFFSLMRFVLVSPGVMGVTWGVGLTLEVDSTNTLRGTLR
jgi:hypothetical protein